MFGCGKTHVLKFLIGFVLLTFGLTLCLGPRVSAVRMRRLFVLNGQGGLSRCFCIVKACPSRFIEIFTGLRRADAFCPLWRLRLKFSLAPA